MRRLPYRHLCHRLRRGIPLLAMLLFATTGQARPAIINGIDAADDEYSEVFAIAYAKKGSASARVLCTAVLVHPRVLITSAHCLPEDPATPITVIEGPDAHAPTATYTSIRTARNAAYFSTQDEFAQNAFDIGVVVLGADVPGADVKTGAKLATLASVENAPDIAAAARDGVIVVGYGGKKSTCTDDTTGTKRWGVTTLIEATRDQFSTDGPVAALSRGDSGGPAFVVDARGNRRLIGIATGSPKDSKGAYSARPSISYYTGMRQKLACWIEQNSGIPLPALEGSLTCNSATLNPAASTPFGIR